MALIILQPTANQTPDAGQGGTIAVTGATNTGHGSTTASATGPGSTEAKSCRWSGIGTTSGGRVSVTLKISQTSSGILGGGGQNAFTVEYTVNGGANWSIALLRENFTASNSAPISVALSNTVDTTQVQVRDLLETDAPGGADSASVTATVSGIQVEVVTDAFVIMMT